MRMGPAPIVDNGLMTKEPVTTRIATMHLIIRPLSTRALPLKTLIAGCSKRLRGESIERNEAYESFSAACLDMRVSRSKNLNPFGALDVTGKPVLSLLTIESQSRKFRHAPFLDFGDDEMMSWRL